MGSWRFVASWRWCVLALAMGGCSHPEAARTASTAAPVRDAARSQKERKVRRLMVLIGAEASGRMMFDLMARHFERSADVPPGFLEKFREMAARESLVDQLVPIYMHHLSEADLDAAIAFHESASGKRFLAAQPRVMQEAKEVGEAWGVRLAQKALEELEEERDTEAPGAQRL
ncbi:DUF2059 domain-containing protein [Melittangium boletus]|uniref:DUF2059 domain-containing protein n=1 Tax=Melittangium boletus TaxID=83453 RepID=UPI003DA490A3